MRLVGHKSEAIYRRYAIVSHNDLLQAARRLENDSGTISGTLVPSRVDSTVQEPHK